MIQKILIVGSGLTGSYLRYNLLKLITNKYLTLSSHNNNNNNNIEENQRNLPSFIYWEVENQIGGRMKSYKIEYNNKVEYIDLGAQYITFSNELNEIINELQDRNILSLFPGKIDGINLERSSVNNYVSSKSLDSTIKYFIDDSSVYLSRELVNLDYDSTINNWVATCSSGTSETFDGVILTIPAPNILNLKGNFQQYLSPLFVSKLQSTRYSSRYALALLYSNYSSNQLTWTSKYVTTDDIIRYISVESKKRSNYVNVNINIEVEVNVDNNVHNEAYNDGDYITVLVHTSIPFYHECNQNNYSKETIQEMILQRLYHHIPNLNTSNIDSSYLHDWKLSQVMPHRINQKDNIDGGKRENDTILDNDYSSLYLPESSLDNNNNNNNNNNINKISSQLFVPFLGFAGDYFTESNFNGCIKSACHLSEQILSKAQKS